MPIIKPNRLNVILVITKKKSIQKGCFISSGINKLAVNNTIIPIRNDFVAAAPTYAMVISKEESGAEKIS